MQFPKPLTFLHGRLNGRFCCVFYSGTTFWCRDWEKETCPCPVKLPWVVAYDTHGNCLSCDLKTPVGAGKLLLYDKAPSAPMPKASYSTFFGPSIQCCTWPAHSEDEEPTCQQCEPFSRGAFALCMFARRWTEAFRVLLPIEDLSAPYRDDDIDVMIATFGALSEKQWEDMLIAFHDLQVPLPTKCPLETALTLLRDACDEDDPRKEYLTECLQCILLHERSLEGDGLPPPYQNPAQM